MLISPRSDFHPWSRVGSITNRTAVYGSVRTVVWEGRRSDPSPYPDQVRAPRLLHDTVSIATWRSAVAAGHFVVGYVIPNCSMYVLYFVGS